MLLAKVMQSYVHFYLQTPSMAICDANLVDSMPRSLTCYGGLDALVHGLESYVSVCATDFTKGACIPVLE
jgi:acetaldehyde dehydrogenase/alcohol dehydrogenase